jgi:hypothetical protein
MHECVHVGVLAYDRVAVVYKNRMKKSAPIGALFNLKYSLLLARTVGEIPLRGEMSLCDKRVVPCQRALSLH